jgi:hypothetical protein
MRALLALIALAGCDRVYGIGDPYEDAPRTGDGSGPLVDTATDTSTSPDAGSDSRTPMPVAHWTFDNDLRDSINGTVGTCMTSAGNGCSFVPGKHNIALHFDGTSCAALDFSNPTQAFSIVVWLQPSNGGYGTVLERPVDLTPGGGDSWFLTVAPTSESFRTRGGLGDRVYNGSMAIASSQWTNVAVTYDPTAQELLYVNGLALTPAANPGAIVYGTTGKLYVGCAPIDTTNTYFAGDIDDLYIFDHALTQTELLSIQ